MTSRQPSNVVPLTPRSSRSGSHGSSALSPPSITEQVEWTLGQALALVCTQELAEVEAATGVSGEVVAQRMGLRDEKRLVAAGADPKQGFPVYPPYFNAACRRLLQDAAREPTSVVTGVWGGEPLARGIPQILLARATPEFVLRGEDRLRIPGEVHFLGEVISAVRFSSRWCLEMYLPNSQRTKPRETARSGKPQRQAASRTKPKQKCYLQLMRIAQIQTDLRTLSRAQKLDAISKAAEGLRPRPTVTDDPDDKTLSHAFKAFEAELLAAEEKKSS